MHIILLQYCYRHLSQWWNSTEWSSDHRGFENEFPSIWSTRFYWMFVCKSSLILFNAGCPFFEIWKFSRLINFLHLDILWRLWCEKSNQPKIYIKKLFELNHAGNFFGDPNSIIDELMSICFYGSTSVMIWFFSYFQHVRVVSKVDSQV